MVLDFKVNAKIGCRDDNQFFLSNKSTSISQFLDDMEADFIVGTCLRHVTLGMEIFKDTCRRHVPTYEGDRFTVPVGTSGPRRGGVWVSA